MTKPWLKRLGHFLFLRLPFFGRLRTLARQKVFSVFWPCWVQ